MAEKAKESLKKIPLKDMEMQLKKAWGPFDHRRIAGTKGAPMYLAYVAVAATIYGCSRKMFGGKSDRQDADQ